MRITSAEQFSNVLAAVVLELAPKVNTRGAAE